ncbi:MAG: Ycf66 family protein [Cyanobacteriota bacterium]
MLAILGGTLALVLGLAVLLLPLLAPELSRARDAAWGAVVLLLGLVLVTSAERLTGAPMLGVLCGGLLIGRLGQEVAQARWRQLTADEQQRLWSAERWQTAVQQLAATTARLLALMGELGQTLGPGLLQRQGGKTSGKRWVRPEAGGDSADSAPDSAPDSEADSDSGPALDGQSPSPAAPAPSPAAVVNSLTEIDALIDRTVAETPGPSSEAG